MDTLYATSPAFETLQLKKEIEIKRQLIALYADLLVGNPMLGILN